MMCQSPRWHFLAWQDVGAMQEEGHNCRGCSSSRRATGTGWKMSSVQCFSLGCVTETAGQPQGLDSTGNPSVGSKKDHRGAREELEEGQRMGRKPTHVAVPSWGWWPQSCPAAAGSGTQAVFGWSVPRVPHEQTRDDLTACVRWTRGWQTPLSGLAGAGSEDGRLLRQSPSCPAGSAAPARGQDQMSARWQGAGKAATSTQPGAPASLPGHARTLHGHPDHAGSHQHGSVPHRHSAVPSPRSAVPSPAPAASPPLPAFGMQMAGDCRE